MKILLAGCGDIGQRDAARLAKEHQCFGLKRNPQFLQSSITPLKGDLSDHKDAIRALVMEALGVDI